MQLYVYYAYTAKKAKTRAPNNMVTNNTKHQKVNWIFEKLFSYVYV